MHGAVVQKIFYEKISKNWQENASTEVSLNKAAEKLDQNETKSHIFSCAFYDIFNNGFFTKYLWMATFWKQTLMSEFSKVANLFLLNHKKEKK